MSPDQQLENLRAIVDKFATHAPSYSTNVINALAADGNLSAIEYMFDQKLVTNQNAVIDSMRLLPVVSEKFFGPTEERATKIAAWERRFGKADKTTLSHALGSCKDLRVAEKLLRVGADPLHSTGSADTPIARAVDQASTEVVCRLLRHCLENDRVPVAQTKDPDPGNGLFGRLVRPAYASNKELVFEALADEIVRTPPGPNCRAELLERFRKKRSSSPDPRKTPKMQFRTILRVANAIALDAEAWMVFANAHADRSWFFHALASRTDLDQIGSETILRMHEAGIDVLAPLAATEKVGPTGGPLVPMLHLAARSDNAEVVSALLSIGANPTQTCVFGKDRERSAAELAAPSSASAKVLAAWTAKQTFSKIASANRP